MQQLTSISGANIYGTDFSYDLAPLTLITGLNTAGKTKILNTVRLILNGYLPRLGATNGATFCAAGNLRDSMAVMGAFQNRRGPEMGRIERTWTRNPKTESVALKENVPAELITPEVLCDFSLFLKMKSAERTAYVFERIKISGAKDIAEQVRTDLEKIRDQFPSKYGDPALKSVLETVNAQFGQAKKFAFNIQETMARTIKALTDQKKLIDAKVKTTSQAILALRHEGPVPVDIQSEIDALYLEQKKVYDAMLLLDASLKESQKQSKARAQMVTDLARAQAELETFTQDKLDAWQKSRSEAPKPHESKLQKAEKEFSDIRVKWSLAGERIKSAKIRCSEIKSFLEALESETACPHCRSKGKGWKAELETTYNNELATAVADLDKSILEEKALKESKDKAEAKVLAARNSDVAALRVQKEFQEAGNGIERHETCKARVRSLTAALATMPEIDAQDALETIKTLKGTETTLAERRLVLGQKQALFTQWKTKRAEMDAATNVKLGLDTESDVFGAAIKAIVAIQEDQLTQTFGQLLKVANQFTTGLVPYELEYRNGEIGWMTPRGWVCNDLFSGYQERLAFSGLQVALCQSAPCKIVMVDEMGTLHPDIKGKFVERMGKLIHDEVIDQCLMIDVTHSDYADYIQHSDLKHIAVE